MIYFTSDLHFYHARVIKYCDRPYSSLEEMHLSLIHNWNSIITSEDTVFLLGDFGFLGVERGKQILSTLKGKIIIIRGNHDESPTRLLKMGFSEVHETLKLEIDFNTLKLCHFPYKDWKGLFYFYKRVLFFKIKLFLSKNPKKQYWQSKIRDYKQGVMSRTPKKTYEDWLLHGHVHNSWPQINVKDRMINVSCDVWDFKPVSLDQIKLIIKENSH